MDGSGSAITRRSSRISAEVNYDTQRNWLKEMETEARRSERALRDSSEASSSDASESPHPERAAPLRLSISRNLGASWADEQDEKLASDLQEVSKKWHAKASIVHGVKYAPVAHGRAPGSEADSKPNRDSPEDDGPPTGADASRTSSFVVRLPGSVSSPRPAATMPFSALPSSTLDAVQPFRLPASSPWHAVKLRPVSGALRAADRPMTPPRASFGSKGDLLGDVVISAVRRPLLPQDEISSPPLPPEKNLRTLDQIGRLHRTSPKEPVAAEFASARAELQSESAERELAVQAEGNHKLLEVDRLPSSPWRNVKLRHVPVASLKQGTNRADGAEGGDKKPVTSIRLKPVPPAKKKDEAASKELALSALLGQLQHVSTRKIATEGRIKHLPHVLDAERAAVISVRRGFNAKHRWKAIGAAIHWATEGDFERDASDLAAQIYGTAVQRDESPPHPLSLSRDLRMNTAHPASEKSDSGNPDVGTMPKPTLDSQLADTEATFVGLMQPEVMRTSVARVPEKSNEMRPKPRSRMESMEEPSWLAAARSDLGELSWGDEEPGGSERALEAVREELAAAKRDAEQAHEERELRTQQLLKAREETAAALQEAGRVRMQREEEAQCMAMVRDELASAEREAAQARAERDCAVCAVNDWQDRGASDNEEAMDEAIAAVERAKDVQAQADVWAAEAAVLARQARAVAEAKAAEAAELADKVHATDLADEAMQRNNAEREAKAVAAAATVSPTFTNVASNRTSLGQHAVARRRQPTSVSPLTLLLRLALSTIGILIVSLVLLVLLAEYQTWKLANPQRSGTSFHGGARQLRAFTSVPRPEGHARPRWWLDDQRISARSRPNALSTSILFSADRERHGGRLHVSAASDGILRTLGVNATELEPYEQTAQRHLKRTLRSPWRTLLVTVATVSTMDVAGAIVLRAVGAPIGARAGPLLGYLAAEVRSKLTRVMDLGQTDRTRAAATASRIVDKVPAAAKGASTAKAAATKLAATKTAATKVAVPEAAATKVAVTEAAARKAAAKKAGATKAAAAMKAATETKATTAAGANIAAIKATEAVSDASAVVFSKDGAQKAATAREAAVRQSAAARAASREMLRARNSAAHTAAAARAAAWAVEAPGTADVATKKKLAESAAAASRAAAQRVTETSYSAAQKAAAARAASWAAEVAEVTAGQASRTRQLPYAVASEKAVALAATSATRIANAVKEQATTHSRHLIQVSKDMATAASSWVPGVAGGFIRSFKRLFHQERAASFRVTIRRGTKAMRLQRIRVRIVLRDEIKQAFDWWSEPMLVITKAPSTVRSVVKAATTQGKLRAELRKALEWWSEPLVVIAKAPSKIQLA